MADLLSFLPPCYHKGMEKASIFITGFFLISFFFISARSVGAQTCPAGYFSNGDFCCNSDIKFEKPDSAFGRKFCQPQATGCQVTGGLFCTAGTRNACCPVVSTCGKGTVYGYEVAVCVPPTVVVCGTKSPGYAGKTKDGKNVCCQVGQEAGPLGRGTNTPYCQPKSASVCAPGESFVQGIGDFQREKRCCSVNTVPSHHLNGLPFCANVPLEVSITNPVPTTESISGLFPLTATFNAPPGGYVKEVKLFIDDNLSWTSPAHPNSPLTRNLITWKLSPGQHKIKFTVTDSNNQTANAERWISIIPDTTPPVVEIVGLPLNGFFSIPFTPAQIASDFIIVTARAKDSSGIGSFEVYLDGSLRQTCSGITTGSYAVCGVGLLQISKLINPGHPISNLLVVAYDRAYNPNRGEFGVTYSKP